MNERDGELARLLSDLHAERPGADGPRVAPDPFFVGRVMAMLPPVVRGTRLSPLRRARLLGSFYAGAAVLAVLVGLAVPEAWSAWSDRAHALAIGATDLTARVEAGRAWLVGLAALVGAAGVLLALAPSRLDTPAMSNTCAMGRAQECAPAPIAYPGRPAV